MQGSSLRHITECPARVGNMVPYEAVVAYLDVCIVVGDGYVVAAFAATHHAPDVALQLADYLQLRMRYCRE